MANKPVFFDASGKRATRLTMIGWVAAAISLILGAVFVANLIEAVTLASVKLPGTLTAIRMPELERKALAPGLLKLAENLAAESRARRRDLAREEKRLLHRSHGKIRGQRTAVRLGRPLSVAFYPDWEPSAYDSLQSALPQLDWVIPTWLTLQGPNMTLKTAFNSHVYDSIRRHPNVAILPVVQNATLGKWDGPGLAKLLADPKRRVGLVESLATYVQLHKMQGITIDFESLPPTAYSDLGAFLKQLSVAFTSRGLTVALASPFGDDKWPWSSYARLVDYTMLMAYDEHSLANVPGSIAGQAWFEATLDKRMKILNPAHTIVALGSYAYDWNDNAVDSLPFQDAVVAAHDSGAVIDFDDASNNPHFSYMEDTDTRHDVWFLDAVTAFNQIHAADIFQPAGYALWRLGSEDPSIWTVMGKPYNSPAPAALKHIPVVEDIDYEGEGELLRVDAEPTSGSRKFDVNRDTGDIDDETFVKLPTGYVIHQFGAAKKEIALTFDDGPDAEWTPRILRILKQKGVHATFFIIGGNAEANPGIVQRMLADGNEIGNHTFTHPNLADATPETVMLELNATQRLFEALTGHSLRLFRPPYLGDAEPTDNDEIAPIQIAQNMGYIAVGEHIDPGDWQLPGADVIVKRSLSILKNDALHQPKNILLLHDAGGDRSQTVEALPKIIDRLRGEGYRFVTVSQLGGLSRDQVMPPLSPTMALLADRVVFLSLSVLGHTLYVCFLGAIWLASARFIFFALLSIWNRRKEDEQFAVPRVAEPFLVSVIIPAFNEEKVIARTIGGILVSAYRNIEIIIVDDGSKDGTVEVVEEQFGTEPRVSLLRAANGGKASALNLGIEKARGEVIVALDADTQFHRDTISRLVRWFSDPKIGAVAGNAKAGNRINMITRWQALEYIVAQNLERRALGALGTLTVVPGAVGAWRRSALLELDGFPTNTLAEDQDLTIAIQRAGYRVMFDNSAVAWTEAPTKLGGLAKQRFRWAFGTLQCLWKYRGMTFRPRYGALGLVALPQVWLFQILLTALAPLADLLLIWQLIWQYLAYLEHGAEFSNRDLMTVGVYYGVFVLIDLVTAIFGFLMERREDWSLLLWLPLQRFGYRQLMYYVIVRSIWTAIRGPFVGWSKLERTGTVNMAHTREGA